MDFYEHAYHVDTLLCCEECGFHSKSDSFDKLEKDGVTISGEHLYCPEGHPVLKRYCELCLDLGDVTSFHAFYRDRNAIKCGACQYPVKIYRTVQLDQGVQLSSEELDLLKCDRCGGDDESGGSGVDSQLVIPFDDFGDVIGVQCVKCYSVQLLYNQDMGHSPPLLGGDAANDHIQNISRATKQEVITWENIGDVKAGDHLEYSIHNSVVYDYDHHFFVHYVDVEAQCLFAYEMIQEGIKDNCYRFEQLLNNCICRKYIYDSSLPFEQSVQMALSRLGEGGYNLFKNNCECFVRWLKTGVHESLQVKRAPWRVLSRIAATFGKIPIQKSLNKVGMAFANAIADDVIGFVDFGGFGAELTVTSLLAFMFYLLEERELKKQLEAGEITQDNYKDRLTEKKWELGGSAVGSVAGSTLALSAMGGVGVGGIAGIGAAMVAGVLGSLLMATLGSWIGKTIVSRRSQRRHALQNKQN